jgi:leucyl-tRNA synthetase
METADFKKIEEKWKHTWEQERQGEAADFAGEKFYVLVEFPYPSGEGLHVGHTRSYTALDVVARKKRMEGKNVLFPMGWDAFGLPAENYAIKTQTHPRVTTEKNISNFRRQLHDLGLSFDWSREVNTTDPAYYKWTQWIFLRFFEKGLAYKKKMYINWCTNCNVGLANEEVVNGVCERCGGEVIQKEREQWMLKITAYAERLLEDLKLVDFPARVRKQQEDWIGKSEGARITFKVERTKEKGESAEIEVFTTRPDTLFGATFLVLSPEHPLVGEITTPEQKEAVGAYQKASLQKSELDRMQSKEKTGVWTGAYALNPATQERIPVWIADYVMMTYGTGAIMAVPAHDERDFEFAEKYNLEIRQVVEEGNLINSGKFTGMNSEEAIQKIGLEFGSMETQFKLRDWVFSRQRYWGEPIPLVYCEKDGWVAVPDDQLPVQLPNVEKYATTETGDSPLANISEWVNVACPKCGGPAKRETDTMPQWAGSSWYYLRYTDPHNDAALADKKNLEYWTPVDWYNGGMEHTTLHLLYSRFWHKFLYDIGVVPTAEPYKKRTSHGLILGPDGEKMSKSRGNVINPDVMVREFGADAYRTYQMFMGPFEEAIPWAEQGVLGTERFLKRVWKLAGTVIANEAKQSPVVLSDAKDLMSLLHKTIKKVTDDIESLKFNTAVSALMILFNELEKEQEAWLRSGEAELRAPHIFQTFLKLLAPFAPFMTEEIWREKLGYNTSIHKEPWPVADESRLKDEVVTIAVQLGGKTRGIVQIAADSDQDAVAAAVQADTKLAKHLEGKKIKKVIFVQDKIINFIV